MFATLALIGSSYRYYQHRTVRSQIEIWHGESASRDSSYRVAKEETTSFPVDVNSADEKKLMNLPGIGSVLAKRIIDHRREHGNFRSLLDFDKVPGVGPALLEKIRDLISFDTSQPSSR